MPYKEFEYTKLYYSIGEVAEMFDVSTSLIRYWENEFDILKPRKNRRGNRLFTKKDIENLKVIYYLVREQGYKIEGAKAKLKAGVDEVAKTQHAVESLQRIRAFLEDLRANL